MAIEKVFIENNTSIIQDEVLAHRLGLIPIKADPRKFEFPGEDNKDPLQAKANEHIVFTLKIKCKKNSAAPPKSTDPDELYIDHKVYSGNLTWQPVGNQAEIVISFHLETPHNIICSFQFVGYDIPEVVEDNILLAKLRPGHEIDLKAHCVKGVGKDHAKFSPVATATYRLLPEIEILEDVYGDQADRLQACFSDGVIEIVGSGSDRKAVVSNARLDSGSREVFRHEDLRDLVRIRKRKDYFLCNICSYS